MKTPMQEHIDWLRERRDAELIYQNLIPYNESSMATWVMISESIKHAELMLEKEKEVMCEFATAYSVQDQRKVSAKHYYNETFNTKEK